jgi:hypothetical protein
MNSENRSKQPNETRKTLQNMKEEFKKDIEILKKNQMEILEMRSSMSQIKKNQSKASPTGSSRRHTEYQGLKTR